LQALLILASFLSILFALIVLAAVQLQSPYGRFAVETPAKSATNNRFATGISFATSAIPALFAISKA
jgi:hypothetical protein